jgi:peptidyl-prolyl cis-trans isomerase SurA
MRKTILLAAFSVMMMVTYAQTLFTYGGKPVSKGEFMEAFNKNPSADTVNRKTALQNYLNLYINYKLKVQDAYDEKLNNSDEYRNEADNFKKQLAEAAINKEANLSRLVDEAYQRSQKDLLLDQFFIPATTDTAAAFKKINEIYAALKASKAIPAGDSIKETPIGYITAFTLPYEVENIVYALMPGGFTAPYHSTAGYHIFILKGERAAVGRRRIQQILFAVPATFSDAEKAAVARTADSVYQLIQNGASFTAIQSQYSSQQQLGKTDIEVSVGQYSPEFEKQVFALQKEGDVSQPFLTDYGYNIIKLIQIIPAAIDANDLAARGLLQEKVEQDDRLETAKQQLVQRWQILTNYKPAPYSTAKLWQYTDSALNNSSLSNFKTINKNTVLFSFAKQKITVTDWLQYLQQQTAKASYPEMMKQFINYATTNYYKNHIEDFDASIKPQLDEFNNANLLFAAMDKHVWTKAAQDSLELLKYYNANKQDYQWAPGADAIVISAGSKAIADEVAAKMKEAPANWRAITGSYGSLVQADSNRFEKDQLPVKDAVALQQGYVSAPEQNDAQDGYTFVYISKVHPQPEQRSFEDARGLVINDYQQVVEARWIEDLKKKYPVVINQQVLNSLF